MNGKIMRFKSQIHHNCSLFSVCLQTEVVKICLLLASLVLFNVLLVIGHFEVFVHHTLS